MTWQSSFTFANRLPRFVRRDESLGVRRLGVRNLGVFVTWQFSAIFLAGLSFQNHHFRLMLKRQ